MLSLPVTVTLREARQTLQTLEQELQGESSAALHLDASGLQQFDTSVLAVLLGCARRAQVQGKIFSVAGAPKPLIELAKLYGVDSLLGLNGNTVNHSPESGNPEPGAGCPFLRE